MIAAMVGLAVTLAVSFVMFAAVFYIELVMTSVLPHVPLPPPTSVLMEGLIVLLSLACAFLVVRRRALARAYNMWLLPLTTIAVAIAVLAATGVITHRYTVRHERDFLQAFADSGIPAATLLASGQQACDWLKQQHWGRPFGQSEPAHLYPIRFVPSNNVIKSTATLEARYGRSGRDDSLVLAAWYRLCPFQEWVHRPIG